MNLDIVFFFFGYRFFFSFEVLGRKVFFGYFRIRVVMWNFRVDKRIGFWLFWLVSWGEWVFNYYFFFMGFSWS